MSAPQLLEFEQDVGKMEDAIVLLRESDQDNATDLLDKVHALEAEKNKKLKQIYQNLDEWQICLVARHPSRPQTLDYINALTTDFMELHGDRLYADDRAIVTGLARFNDSPVAVIGHQKGTGTEERIERNFGMAGPEGYRKLLRVMALANKFTLPILSFIDTPGAYPGIGAEERGQSSAIGTCLYESIKLRVPFIVIVIGEGGSGGALAMSVGDHLAMLQYSVYSVISPEGCASILWKDGSRMAEAASLLGLTAPKLKKLGLIDDIIPEPTGGAHRNPAQTIASVGANITQALQKLQSLSPDKLIETRHKRWRNHGKFREG